MTYATHIIKIKGEFDKELWNKEKLKKYVDKKIESEIDNDYCHPDLENFHIHDGNKIDVWVFVSCIGYPETILDMAKQWCKNHITEEGLKVENVEVGDMRWYANDKKKILVKLI